MTKISNVSNLLLGATTSVATALVLQSAPASAANLTFSSATVDATDTTGLALSGGGNFLSTDFFSLSVSGTPNFAPSATPYVTNAAGILTQDYNGGTFVPTGGFFVGPNSASLGSLLIGNSTLGYFQLFPSNSANGAGSATPLTSLSFSNVTLGSIFGNALDTTPTSTLNLITNDSFYTDNTSGYIVSGSISSTPVPEPFTIVGTLVGGTAAVRMRKKLKAAIK
jgi:hypothetical protein